VLHRWFVSIMSTLLVACAGPVRESVARSESRASAEERMEARTAPTHKAATATARKPPPQAQRDAKASFSPAPELEEATSGADAFAGVDTEAPTDSTTEQTQQAVAVKGIEGTMSEYDVRTTLESRDEDFDRCHEGGHGGGGKIQFRIHILANGDVGEVKVHRLSGHNGKIDDCYTDVVSTSHFSAPHGGYADVKWTTKVGRSRGRPDATFERRGRWDTPATGGDAKSSESSESRRERRHHRHHRKGV
jgi:hypothetical protein